MTCYKNGSCGVYEMRSCAECPASKPEYLNRQEKRLLTESEFIREYCHRCGSQRCEGIGTDWFDGCQFKDRLMSKGE